MSSLGTQLDLILTSPYLRAADTARILRKQLDVAKDKLVEMPDLAPVGKPDQLIADVARQYGSAQNIALVGHEPSLSRLISVLLSGDPTLPIMLKKGGVCCLSAEKLEYGRCATLEWLMAPAQLVDLAG